ncbi:DUF4012 domain-containing protein [Candidatus Parcubacteria bacterium]|nr:DUF4012 domain-containing protein [Patescibacteria group bacterium]MBU4380695.1 DUF4012 domain-containing protein [Patescibacteria group bacterium]MCG2689612.1 DUF4012 domain-containing protein [Candidatus Parcubacteria bacterium]
MPPQSSSVLIARGNNLVGRKLTERLLSSGFKVSLTATPSPLEEIKLKPFLDNPNFKLLALGNIEKIKKECNDTKVIYYFINEAQLDPKETQDFDNILNFAVTIKARVILVSDLSVYQGVVSSASLDEYFGTSENDEKRFSQVEHKRYLEAVAWKVFKNKQLDLALVRLSTVYGSQMEFTQYPMGSMVKDVLENRPIVVKGNGLSKHYFMHVDDATEALIKVSSLSDFSGKILVAIDKNLVAEIEIAYLLKALSKKKIEIKFTPATDEIVFTEPPALDFVDLKTVGFSPKISLKEGLMGVLEYYGFFNSLPIVEQVLPQASSSSKSSLEGVEGDKKEQKDKVGKVRFALISIVLFALLAHPLVYTAKAYFGISYFYKSLNFLNELDVEKAQYNAARAYSLLKQTSKPPAYLNYLQLSSFLKVHLYAVTAEINYLKAYDAFPANYEESVAYTTLADTNLSLAQTESKKVSQNFLKSKMNQLLNLNSLSVLTSNLPDLVKSLYQIMGYDKPKSYILLFTDTAKLRPTGGTIVSYAKVSLDKGKVISVDVDDGKAVDGTLQEKDLQTKSPEPLEVLQKEPNFVFSDMLWEPFFPSNAGFILDTFNNMDRKEYSGVVSLNSQIFSELLNVTGEIYVSANDRLVNANNVQGVLKSYLEQEGNGVSFGNKSFVSNLVYNIFQKLLEGGYSQKHLLSILYKNLSQKQILAYIPQTSFFSKMNWDGNTQAASRADYLFVVDANLSGARTNDFIKRDISYIVNKSDVGDGLSSTLTIGYGHTGKSNAWPGGSYVNYLRVLVPYGSKVVGAKIIDATSQKSTNILNGIATNKKGFLTSFETSFEIKAQEKIKVQLVYDLPLTVFDSSRIEKGYSLVVQKQSGTVADPFNFVFNAGAESFKSQTLLSEDRYFDIKP